MKYKALITSSLVLLLMIFCPNLYQSRHSKDTHDDRTLAGCTLTCGVPQGLGLDNYLNYGFHYRMLKSFGEHYHCNIDIHPIKDTVNFCDSLLMGIYDLVIVPEGDSVDTHGILLHHNADSSIIWATVAKKPRHALVYDSFLAYASREDKELIELAKLFNYDCRHQRQFFNGVRRSHISPYDDIIKEYAPTVGWDWRLLAALIYKESRFYANALSPKGAVGIMQVVPNSVEKFDPGDLYDPVENIRVGTLYLKTLLDRHDGEDISAEERDKFAIGSYNAGFYHIDEARDSARVVGVDANVWDNVAEAFCLVPDFDGSTTKVYVQKVLETYEYFCLCCPRR